MSQVLCSCVGINAVELGVSPAPSTTRLHVSDKPPASHCNRVSEDARRTHLWYVLPAGNLTSGHAQASEKDTTRVAPAGTDVDAATAAPTDDPAFDAALAALPAPACPNAPSCCRLQQTHPGPRVSVSREQGFWIG